MDEQAFREQARREGFEDPTLVDWAAGTVNGSHAHAFDCSILVLAGELTVATDAAEKTYQAGDSFQMARDKPHAERVGPDDVKMLIARK